jgi:hypothetical protein
MRTIGILLIVVGAIMMAITGINLVTKKEVVDVGPLEINKTENHPINWSPILGGVLFVGGIVLVATSRKRA